MTKNAIFQIFTPTFQQHIFGLVLMTRARNILQMLFLGNFQEITEMNGYIIKRFQAARDSPHYYSYMHIQQHRKPIPNAVLNVNGKNVFYFLLFYQCFIMQFGSQRESNANSILILKHCCNILMVGNITLHMKSTFPALESVKW